MISSCVWMVTYAIGAASDSTAMRNSRQAAWCPIKCLLVPSVMHLQGHHSLFGAHLRKLAINAQRPGIRWHYSEQALQIRRGGLVQRTNSSGIPLKLQPFVHPRWYATVKLGVPTAPLPIPMTIEDQLVYQAHHECV